MAKHTPGPWSVSRDGTPEHHYQATVYEGTDGRRVATVFETEANARLIAQAPCLLMALEELVAEFDARPWDWKGPWFGRNDTCGIDMARHAISLCEEDD